MLEKFKNMFNEKDEKKKTDNLIAFLIILVITLIIINKILNSDSNKNETTNETNVELVSSEFQNTTEESLVTDEDDLEKRLEDILSKMTGVGKTEVLLTYSETSSISPLYNESTSSSTTTDSDGSTTETKTESKDVFTDGNSEAVLEKKTMPKLEGAIVIAEGAGDSVVKTNIIEAVEAVTGLLSHKVQVFEMKKDN
jgi:stage III sporulation protein AG